MPLEATHIRFALDLQDKYEIKDLRQYISGAVYPDSRYITGIDRKLTHDDRCLLPEFAADDFKKGWQTHKICDHTYDIVRKRLFPDLFPGNFDFYSHQDWIISTAMKIIYDIEDMQSFDIQKYLNCLEYASNPNNEDISAVKEYNKILIDLYKNKKAITIEDSINMWKALGQDESICAELRKTTENLLKDQKMVARIKLVYQEALDSYEDIVSNKIKILDI